MLSAFVVNSTLDTHDAAPGDGIAADSAGRTTLRAAIEEANAHIGADTITLPAGVITLSAVNGPLVITDDLEIIGTPFSGIDGTAFDEIFSQNGAAHLHIDNVEIRTSHDLAASLRPVLLTTNTRQADLIVAFSAIPTATLPFETKPSSGLSPLIGFSKPEREIADELLPINSTAAIDQNKDAVKPGESVIESPTDAIDAIINALFRSPSSDKVRPAGIEDKPTQEPDSSKQSPMSSEMSQEAPPKDETPSSDADPKERSRTMPDEDEAVRMVLRGWADEAGWNDFDFLTRGTQVAVAKRTSDHRLTTMVSVLLGGLVAKSWAPIEQTSKWRNRLARLRRRPR